jgi:hypothetical protein
MASNGHVNLWHMYLHVVLLIQIMHNQPQIQLLVGYRCKDMDARRAADDG